MAEVSQQEKERQRYIQAFNSTMVNIWKEKIALLGAVRTGALYNSVVAVGMDNRGRFLDVTLRQRFNAYGVYVNYGTGSNTWRGNPGDIGRPNARKKKPWFSPKYYGSVMNLREFMADNLGREGAYVIAEALNVDSLRRSLQQ